MQITTGYDDKLSNLRDLVSPSIPHTLKIALVDEDEARRETVEHWIMSHFMKKNRSRMSFRYQVSHHLMDSA